jgi:AraC-like DNA-binding protein
MKKRLYKNITPADVYSVTPVDASGLIPVNVAATGQWMVVHPSGNSFIDLFAQLVHRHGNMPAKQYASAMGLETRLLTAAIVAMTGMGPREWVCEYLRMASCALLEKTKLPVSKIGKLTGFSSVAAFSQFFHRAQKCQPYEWRNRITYHYYEKPYFSSN